MVKYAKEDITPAFLKEWDGRIVWIRDDYLSMRDICASSDPDLHDFLEHVVKVKEQVRAEGYWFAE